MSLQLLANISNRYGSDTVLNSLTSIINPMLVLLSYEADRMYMN